MLTKSRLQSFLNELDCLDDAEIVILDFSNMCRHVKHVHLATYRDGSGTDMIVFTGMGSHIQDDDLVLKGGVC